MDVTNVGGPALKFSTLFELTEAGRIYSHESCQYLLGMPLLQWVLME